MDTRIHVDTLSGKERLSLRTNAVDWLLLVPNIGVEYDIKNLNWNRWSVGLNLRYNWQASHTFKPGVVYNVGEVRAEVRNYYRIRVFDGKMIEPHKHIWERVVSPRREESHHPTTTYYRGAFLAYNNHAIKLADTGHQGNAIIAGGMWGMIKPLYEFSSGNTLDLEFAAAAGVAYSKYDTFRHDREDDCYPITGQKTTVLPVINELRVGFVYRFGSYPVTKKYRWRYDVDTEYQQMVDSTIRARRDAIAAQALADSLDAVARKMFWEKYDSLAKINKVKNDSLNLIEKAQAAEKAAKQKAQKEADRAARQEQRKQEADQRKQEKRAPKEQAEEPKPEATEPTENQPEATEPKAQAEEPKPGTEEPTENQPEAEEPTNTTTEE